MFGLGYVDVSATEALSAVNENKSPGPRDEAKKLQLAIPANGPVAKTEMKKKPRKLKVLRSERSTAPSAS